MKKNKNKPYETAYRKTKATGLYTKTKQNRSRLDGEQQISESNKQ